MPALGGEGEVVYPTVDDVLALYADGFRCTDKQAADQVRRWDGLASAVARPAMRVRYREADLALQAAVLAHAIAEGQLFLDGNKRTALVVCLTFLEVNGWRVAAAERQLADWIIGLSSGDTPEALAEKIRERLRPLSR